MSSIPQQEQMKPAPKSPIPRSRSDFSYVGLTPREKRWTTDFSLLLPPFSRDTSGYSRLTETPVTLQPKPRNQAVTKLSKSPTLDSNRIRTATQTLSRSPTLEPCVTRRSPTSETTSSNETKPIGRSQTMEPVTNCTSTSNSNEIKRTKPVRRSPTLEPYNPKCSSTNCSTDSKCSVVSKTLYPTMELSCSLAAHRVRHPLGNHLMSDASRLPMSKHLATETCRHSMGNHSSSEANHQLMVNHPTPETSRHLVAIRKSPTMDSKTLRYSPLLSQHIISRSPTLDPSVLSRNPRCCHMNGSIGGRSPLTSRVGTSSEVVRSQSLRSLKKGMDKSPLKIRNSDSAQSDVTCPIHKAFPLVEADEYDEDDLCRLRNFSVTPKGLINWGDSFRSQSLTSVPGFDRPPSCSSSQWDVASTKSYPMTSSNSQWNCNKTPQRYKVAIMGADEVGKTSLIRQFQTSEYICAFETSYDINKEYAITVILNKEESELEFIEHRLPEEESDEKDEKTPASSQASSIPYADAHVVVYSVTNRRSFSRAVDLLSKVQKLFRRSAVVLVGNKSDLVRVRAVTTDDGQTAAKEKNNSFIETSAAINHQVDELLVAILTQIRAKCKSSSDSSAASRWNSSQYSLSKAKGLIKKFLKKACFQSKSSDNLQRL